MTEGEARSESTPAAHTSRRHGAGLADVAERAGVSPSLVSRILRGDGSLRTRDETRVRVLDAAQELGYVAHGPARALRQARAGALGLVVHDVTNPIHSEIVVGAQEATSEAGCVLLLGDAAALGRDDATLRQFAAAGRIDGLLWQTAGDPVLDERVSVAAGHIPTVLVNSCPREGLPTAVRLHDEKAAGLAVQHLVSLDHQRIGYLGGSPASGISARRRDGYRSGLDVAGVEHQPDWESEGGWDSTSGYNAMRHLLGRRDGVTAVVVVNVVVAMGAMAAAREAGVRLPEDMSFVAVHDSWFAPQLTPPVTTVRMPLREMGRRAARLLLAPAGANEHEIVISDPPPELVVRGSTTSCPSPESAAGKEVPRR